MLEKDESGYIFQEHGIDDNHLMIRFAYFPYNKLDEYYSELIDRMENDKKNFLYLKDEFEFLESIDDPKRIDLPFVYKLEDVFGIETATVEKEWRKLEANDHHIKISNVFAIEMTAMKNGIYSFKVMAREKNAEEADTYILLMTDT